MKALVLLGLLVVGASVAPAATAHLLVRAPDPLTGECVYIPVGSPTVGPHPTVWVSPCGPGGHTGPILP